MSKTQNQNQNKIYLQELQSELAVLTTKRLERLALSKQIQEEIDVINRDIYEVTKEIYFSEERKENSFKSDTAVLGQVKWSSMEIHDGGPSVAVQIRPPMSFQFTGARSDEIELPSDIVSLITKKAVEWVSPEEVLKMFAFVHVLKVGEHQWTGHRGSGDKAYYLNRTNTSVYDFFSPNCYYLVKYGHKTGYISWAQKLDVTGVEYNSLCRQLASHMQALRAGGV